MANEKTHDDQGGLASRRGPRRKFFRWLGGAAALGALSTSGDPSASALPETKVPMPAYLPPGYSLAGTFTDRPDGFRTGSAEISFLYLNPAYRGGFPNPLLLFVSPPTTHDFEGTQGHTPELVQLTLTIGNVVEARYFDGMWTPSPDGEAVGRDGKTRIHWDTTNFNALTFPFERFLIGLRGCRKGKVDRNELIRIAGSMS